MRTILIIDDEDDVADALRRVLEREGFSVTTAGVAEDGIAEFRRHPTDIVITDIIMPHLNGVEVIKAIRGMGTRTGIVAISGGGNFGPQAYKPEAITTTAYLAAAQQAGADAVLTKPFDRDDLLATLRQLLMN